MSVLRCSGLRRYRMLVVAVALALCMLGALCLALYGETQPPFVDSQQDNAANDQRKYGIVIDAGSSGSRVMIYAWNDPSTQQRSGGSSSNSSSAYSQSLELPAIERAGEHWAFKTSPGISSFGDRPQRVGAEHIRPLLDFAQKHIPRHQIAHTPVYLVATAGMRLLPRSQQMRILDAACGFARSNYAFLLPDCHEAFHVVSGELEGLYGWVAVNYLMGGFSANDKHSLGFLDMGGASAQIAFEPTGAAARLHRHDLARVTLRSMAGADVTRDVFVATFLGHGTNEARRRYVDGLRLQAVATGGALLPVADDPCLAAGLALPTVDGQAVLRGNGRFSDCVAATEPLLNNSACAVEPCLFAGVHAPAIDFGVQRFVGVSEYWYASHDYLQLGGVWDVEKFEAKAQAFCELPWAEAVRLKLHSEESSEESDAVAVARLQMQCFKAAWLVNVLHKGFGVPRGAGSAPFQSVNHVDGIEVSWTLGALLLKVSGTIPANRASIAAKTQPGIVLPDNPHTDEGAVDLADDALWSPLQFAGIRRLLVLWALQPAPRRALLALAAVGAFLLAGGLVYWLVSSTTNFYWRRGRPIGSGAPSPIPMQALVASGGDILPPSPSQLGLAEAQYSAYDRAREYEASLKAAARESPSVFVMDLLSNGGGSTASMSPGRGGGYASPLYVNRPHSGVAEMSPISRSSSVVNLALSSRRRPGNGSS
ncbi:Golgi apyrase [Coemansia sp. BCRC 34301]|nr:Golgi apyrase [Coemansia sp. BCRC 34301]